MRTPNPTARRLQNRARARRRPMIAELALLVDDALGAEPGHAAAHLSFTDGDEIEIGVLPMPTALHPFSVLAGTLAPEAWGMFGVRAQGRARALSGRDLTEGPTPTDCTTTYLVCRSGEEVAVLREGERTSVIHEPAQGTIPDLCRLVLGLPTPAAPAPTQLLFTLAWLDRVHRIALAHPNLSLSASAVAALHPARTKGADAEQLVREAAAHAAAWSWARLRAEPDHLELPGSDLPVEITSWMDDGAFARWALGSFPPIDRLQAGVTGVLRGTALQLVGRATELMATAGALG